MQLQGKAFYRGLADPDDATSALLFTSNEKLELLKESSHVYFDTTFKVVPRLYYQLFTVFVPYADAAFPVLYALMTRKTHAAYLALFQNLKELIPYFTPLSAMADYEEASTSAFQAVFGNVIISGCWFHYGQALVKRMAKIGLRALAFLYSVC